MNPNADEGASLQGQPAEVSFTLTVTRAATGKVETFDMVGHVEDKEQDGNDTLDGGTQRGD